MNLKDFGLTIKQKYPSYSDMADEELGRMVLEKYPQYASVVKLDEKPTGLVANLKDTAQERFTDALKSGERYQQGKQTLPETVLQMGGHITGGLVEGAIETAGAGIKKIADVTGITPVAKKVGLALLQTPVGAEALSALEKGMDAYDSWKKKNPRLAEDIEAVVDIASFATMAMGAQSAVKGAVQKTKQVVEGVKTGIANETTIAKKALTQKALSAADDEIESLIKSKRSISNAAQLLETKKRVPIRDMLKDKNVFAGLKIEKGTINPDDALDLVGNRIDNAMAVTKKILPEVDKYAPQIKKSEFAKKALSYIDEQGLLPADKKSLVVSLNTQLKSLPNEFLPSELDAVRAMARESSRTAKGLLKSSSEYAAMENAARDLVFASADKLPAASGGEFAQLRNFIKQNIELSNFLDKTLRGQKVAGGRLGIYAGRVLGAMSGSAGGPFATYIGNELGAKVAEIMINNQLGSSVKMKLIKLVTDNPEVIKLAEEMLKKQANWTPKLLSTQSSVIQLPAKGVLKGQEVLRK